MKQKTIRTKRRNHLATIFDQLCTTDQQYMDTLTAQLAKIQKIAPEIPLSTGRKPKNRVQQNKEQEK